MNLLREFGFRFELYECEGERGVLSFLIKIAGLDAERGGDDEICASNGVEKGNGPSWRAQCKQR